jgi:hypothetical protein
LDGLNVQEAKLIIEACKDLDLLSRWHAREGRKTVKKALVERVAALQAPAQPPVEPEVESEDAEGVDDLEDEDIFDGTGPEG